MHALISTSALSLLTVNLGVMIVALTGGRPDWLDVQLSGLAFFANHLYSYLVYRHAARRRIQNIGGMMFFPYIRVVPMHVFIVFGALVAEPGFALIFFLVLKTLADKAMHAIEHRVDG